MGINVNIFGYIECRGRFWMPASNAVFHHNKRVIAHLPDCDSEPPYITRAMFSMMWLATDDDAGVPQYESHLIYFAGSYKNLFPIDAEWLAIFESILAQLCLCSAVVIEDFCRVECRWNVDVVRVTEQFASDPPQPPKKWAFVARSFDGDPAANADAIIGQFSSAYHQSLDRST